MRGTIAVLLLALFCYGSPAWPQSVPGPGGGTTSLGTGIATFLATPSSANLASAITNETGSSGGGLAVFNKSPSIDTPTFGVVLQGNGNVLSTPAAASGVNGNSASNECNQTLSNGGLALNWVLATNVGGVRHEVLCVDANGDLVFPRMVYYQTMGAVGAPYPDGFNPPQWGGQINQYITQGDHFSWYVFNSDAGVSKPAMQLYTGTFYNGAPALVLPDVNNSGSHLSIALQSNAGIPRVWKQAGGNVGYDLKHHEAGACTLSSGACTFTFAVAYDAAPFCTVSPTTTGTFTTTATLKVAPSTTAVVVSDTTSSDNAAVHVNCAGI